MDYKTIIGNNTLVICNDDIKNKILSYLNDTNELFSIKFMNINEVVKSLFFDYDEKSIHYLMDKYDMPYEVVNTYIKNMYYVEYKEYDSNKLNTLVKYKQELDDNNLLIKDKFFIDFISNKRIVFIKRDISKYDRYIIDILKKYTDVEIYDFKYDKYEHKVYEFSTIDKEIEYVAYSICELINSGIDINNIKISNIDKDYTYSIKRIFGYYNIPINLPSNSYLIGTKIAKDFIDNYDSDINNTIESIEKYKDSPLYNQIINICNKYYFVDDYLEVKDMIIHDLANTLVRPKRYSNAIEVIDYKDIIEDEYVFLMNFNLRSMPKVYKDEDYITDNIKPDYLDNTVEKNKLEKESTIKCIDSIKNLVITYKLKSPTDEFYPSNLVDRYAVEYPSIDIYKSHSRKNDKLKLASCLDRLVKYGNKSSELNVLKYNYDIPYLEYDNKYSKVDTDNLYKMLKNELRLSYSTLEQYYECPFKYYLNNVLRINISEDNFGAILGSVFHHILELGVKEDIDIDNEVTVFLQKEYKDHVFSKKETFFLENAKKDMRFVLDTIKKQMSLCKLNGILTEENVFINKDKNIKIIFKGIIDKLLYKEEEDNTILAIIDYKTGKNVDIDLGYMEYGIGLQLPIYLYLASNLEFKNIRFAGIYLQRVMPEIDKLKDLEKKSREDKLKLDGYSNNDQSVLGQFDITYADSKVINGIKLKQDGHFQARSKVLSDEQFKSLISLANNKIDNCIDKVLNGEFDIKPIMKDNDRDVTACAFCSYKDICFRTNDDIEVIEKDKELSFLGGESNE